eukprot:TRINITY_DN13195_c0_g1_i3.p3 TRINITY_DN13195_c0_g1~~TRINITY_DN13195_c0_g1_i3.p3  ORF type:complete len:102 (-),score=2.01 TRINITY_DN13195_c0_g1_i3:64-369(-)
MVMSFVFTQNGRCVFFFTSKNASPLSITVLLLVSNFSGQLRVLPEFNTTTELSGNSMVVFEPYATFTLQLSLIHISEPTRLGMISYAVFCLKKKKNTNEFN